MSTDKNVSINSLKQQVYLESVNILEVPLRTSSIKRYVTFVIMRFSYKYQLPPHIFTNDRNTHSTFILYH